MSNLAKKGTRVKSNFSKKANIIKKADFNKEKARRCDLIKKEKRTSHKKDIYRTLLKADFSKKEEMGLHQKREPEAIIGFYRLFNPRVG